MEKFIHKKSLGQNFLKNDTVIHQIVDFSHIIPNDIVVEIGPGQGILTEALAQKAGGVIAIELDERLIPILEQKFKDRENVTIIHGDVLHMNINSLISGFDTYKVVANIPYYITAPIIRLFLEQEHVPGSLTLMVQKEVAERLCARPGDMSIIAVAAQYYADVEYGFTVSRNDFDPVPAVDSAVITLHVKKDKPDDSKTFFRVVKIGFSARRKTLCNNIANGYHKSKDDVVGILRSIGLGENVRAQELSIEQWKILAEKLDEK
jgi:16S rRNA (adenine1518-N6/adenine1519-N6)-dimethyltransferase